MTERPVFKKKNVHISNTISCQFNPCRVKFRVSEGRVIYLPSLGFPLITKKR